MKDGIHPPMYPKARTTCMTCKAVFDIPTTVEKQEVEVCRNCHSVYTGKVQKARGGRIERFKKRAQSKQK